MKGIRCQLARLSIALLFALFATIYMLSRTVFLDGYEVVEEQQMTSDLKRATDAITFRLRELDRTAIDWSAWDDTYRFISDRNAAYIASNLPDKAISSIDVNLMRFSASGGGVILSKWVAIASQQEATPPAGLAEALQPVDALLKTRTIADGVRGIVMLPQGPMLVAARHIITSRYTGPANGSFVAGRLIDRPLLDQIRNQTRLDLELYTGTNGLSSRTPLTITRLDDHTIQGKQIITDILGTPVLTLQVTSKRSVFQLGRQASRNTALVLVLAGTVIATILFVYGERGIVRHLVRMSSKADEIARTGDVQQRLAIAGAPELQRLGAAVNNMLESLEKAHQEVQQSELKHRVVLQQSRDAIILFDPLKRQIRDANPAFFAITGFAAETLPQLTPADLVITPEKLPALIRLVRRRRQLSLEGVLCRHHGGSTLEMDISVSLLTIDGQELISAMMRDVTKRNQEQRMIRDLAITDFLTGIPNRRHLFDRAEQELERLKRSRHQQDERQTLGCLIIDIDHFKLINDSRGHQCGDAVLKELGRRLAACVRPYDVIGRYGGEEFVVVVVNATTEQTLVVAERIWNGIRSVPFCYAASSFPVTASLGVSFFMADDDTLDSILHRADTALYQAKQTGRDRITLDSSCQV